MSKKNTGKVFDMDIFMRLMSFAKKYRIHFFMACFAAISLAIIAAFRPYLIIETVDGYIKTKDQEGLLYYSMWILSVLIVEVLLHLSFIYIANWLGQHIIKDIRIQLFEHVIKFKMSYFDKSSVGQMVTRVVSDVETIAQFFGQGLFMIVSDLLKMVVIAAFMLYTDWKLALISFTVLPVLIYATKVFQRSIKVAFQQVRTQVASLNGFVQERVTGMKIVQLFSREKIEYDKFVGINEVHKKAHIKTVWYFSIFYPIAEILSSVAVGLIVWFGGLNVAFEGTVTTGEVIGFIMMSEMLFRPLRQIADKFTTLQMGMVAGNRVFEIMDTDEIISKEGNVAIDKLEGTISFKDVHFSYVKSVEVLKGISLEVEAGKTIAIVGSTGAGKSTIINLINRFYEIDSGSICVDGVDIKDYKLHSLRNHIAIVLQDVFLFSDSILNNITLKKKEITLEQVTIAAKKIGIHDFIMSLPGGYHYNVKERGGMLSSGQRQLIAFLRAYVSDPCILILDEATSSVDSYSEQMIQYATDTITKNRTSIIIAHRLATIQKADAIIVMDKGLIVEQGSHHELLKRENGHYRNLFEKQFSDEVVELN
ncbi:ABC transporter ATP-binding protein [Flavicella sediminum]|uniref:ABC transporter ATP-binding protein n=1 Tax=Flavicella sediminum TaxID=2585141 RepID=UPI00111FA3C5|nr:ABC transporter ATP-binding protein [Flavicella sediminum]